MLRRRLGSSVFASSMPATLPMIQRSFTKDRAIDHNQPRDYDVRIIPESWFRPYFSGPTYIERPPYWVEYSRMAHGERIMRFALSMLLFSLLLSPLSPGFFFVPFIFLPFVGPAAVALLPLLFFLFLPLSLVLMMMTSGPQDHFRCYRWYGPVPGFLPYAPVYRRIPIDISHGTQAPPSGAAASNPTAASNAEVRKE